MTRAASPGQGPRDGGAGRTVEVMTLVEEGKITAARALLLLGSGDGERAAGAPVIERPVTSPEIDQVMKELDGLVGLAKVKRLVLGIKAFIEVQRFRAREHLATEPLVLHMVFKGNPGTGKTTVARILGRIFKEVGVLQKGHLCEVERADLVGEYIGHTAQKTREQIRRAIGGILFIDEAYSLARGGEKDFGKEAIDTLVKAMEDHKDELVVVLAGYLREMDYFLRTNPGLKSRFPIHIEFPDFTLEELLKISDIMLDKREYVASPEAREALAEHLRAGVAGADDNAGNARLVRNVIERAIRCHAVRLTGRERGDAGLFSRQDLMLIIREDVLAAIAEGRETGG
ncbi:MAG TPA: AAA family ATPase [Bacillota bacterium]|jgi:stage V sporulation protein K